jgi:hypothetical protein
MEVVTMADAEKLRRPSCSHRVLEGLELAMRFIEPDVRVLDEDERIRHRIAARWLKAMRAYRGRARELRLKRTGRD